MTTDWLNTDEYPFKANYFKLKGGHTLHYIDEGNGETILFVHGTPSWSFDFRHLIKTLCPHYRCIAIDHIGFGLSDKPKDYDYSTLNHSHTLENFVASLQLEHIHLVMHDFGGPIGLHFALKHPENIKSMTILNSWMWSSAQTPEFKKFSKILRSPLLPFLYKNLNFSASYLLPASFGDKKLERRLKQQYTSPFQKASERQGPLAFAKSLLNDQDWFETLWIKKEVLQSQPLLLVWGMKDKFVGAAYLEKFRTGFPNSTVKKLPNCGHFPQEEEAVIVSETMLSFLKKQTTKESNP